MDFGITREQIERWVDIGKSTIRRYDSLAQEVGRVPALSYERKHVAAVLGTSCSMTSDSALILTGSLRFWDAEILLRSVLEGTLRLVYLSTGSADAQATRLSQYYDQMPDIIRLKRSDKASTALGILDKDLEPQWQPIRDLVLNPAEANELKSQYDRTTRKQMDQSWSVFGLIQEIAKSDFPAGADFPVFLFGYLTSSGYVHKDYESVAAIFERQERSEERRISIAAAHASRQVSDACTLAYIRARAVRSQAALDIEPVRDVWKGSTELFAEFAEAQRLWNSIEYGSVE